MEFLKPKPSIGERLTRINRRASRPGAGKALRRASENSYRAGFAGATPL
jgi:hypothetical protein